MIDIERLAREAGMNTSMWEYGAGSMVFTLGIEGVARGAIERFAARVRNEVLEEAAKACDEIEADRWSLYKGRPPYTGQEKQRASDYTQGESDGAELCASFIRALKEKK